MIPEETKELLAVPKRHPIVFILVYLPVVASVAVASFIFRFTLVYALPLLWCFFTSLFLIQGVYSGQLRDNQGTSLRKRSPIRFWGKVAIWSALYVLVAVWSIGVAVQEQNKNAAEPSFSGDVLHAAPKEQRWAP